MKIDSVVTELDQFVCGVAPAAPPAENTMEKAIVIIQADLSYPVYVSLFWSVIWWGQVAYKLTELRDY